jgi:RNA polymerase sigma-70 factor (ECF subfamily)
MSPRDLYTVDDGDEPGLERLKPDAGRFSLENRDPGEGKRRSDLEIEKKFLQLTRIDPEQFRFFYEKYHDVIFNYIFLKTEDYELAGDLTGDVFLEALTKLDEFTWQGYSFGAWLFHIARRTVGRHYRRAVHPAESVFETNRIKANAQPTPGQETVRSQDMHLVRQCMRQLSPDKNDALVFHYWLDMTVKDIAVVMKTSESNVKKHLVRGRRHMLKWFKEHGLDLGLSEAGRKMIREVDAFESGWHLVDQTDE